MRRKGKERRRGRGFERDLLGGVGTLIGGVVKQCEVKIPIVFDQLLVKSVSIHRPKRHNLVLVLVLVVVVVVVVVVAISFRKETLWLLLALLFLWPWLWLWLWL